MGTALLLQPASSGHSMAFFGTSTFFIQPCGCSFECSRQRQIEFRNAPMVAVHFIKMLLFAAIMFSKVFTCSQLKLTLCNIPGWSTHLCCISFSIAPATSWYSLHIHKNTMCQHKKISSICNFCVNYRRTKTHISRPPPHISVSFCFVSHGGGRQRTQKEIVQQFIATN